MPVAGEAAPRRARSSCSSSARPPPAAPDAEMVFMAGRWNFCPAEAVRAGARCGRRGGG